MIPTPATQSGIDIPRTQCSVAQQRARQEAAMHCVRLAVQRWRTGYAAAEFHVPSSQERWFANAHGQFTAWLSAGGFAQDNTEPAAAALPARPDTANTAPSASAPHMKTAA